ncbi:AAA family ATPase [Anaerotruncus sp. 80]|uniref:AAA family ATPase n=1 Tax=Anaerotruncus colihominis TaxID=169435 RepID=A0A845QIQ4_9FIRM|nr:MULTISPECIES: sigma 54-interacting transcriptional regulator [Anaerotruncus]NBH61446.1 AAA family ATPase [Anaerotruncus colihominis]NCF02101.1 AAA family ATPase [Anaerotruncus sp. 80]
MELSNYVKQILNIYNYYDGAIIMDRKGIIEYYYNSRKDINTLTNEETRGKSLFTIYPDLERENSSMFEVVRTGKPLLNQYQKLINYRNETYEALFSTFPIYIENQIAGCIEVFLYLEEREEHLNIFIMNSKTTGTREPYLLRDIVSVSAPMEQLKERIIQASRTKSTVLIYGETGTGKELVAQALHANSSRGGKRFLSQNCAAIPENLLESILFGTVKGGFTNAENHMGLFEAASGGTLFLDEVNSMDLAVQAKLLRVLEEQKVTRIGSTKEIPVDVRIIAAMNESPKECVQNGTLREDLYYRLRVVQLDLPPLRERKEDIVPLIEHYIDFFNRTMQRQIKGVSSELMAAFCQYTWPGNVRELRNMIESGFNLCEGDVIDMEDIDINVLAAAGEQYDEKCLPINSLKARMQRFERYILQEALTQCGSITDTAACLGISRQTLSAKMKSLEIADICRGEE